MSNFSFRALIVDPKPPNAHLLRGLLVSAGASEVVVAENSEFALDLLRTCHFDAVFCDELARPLNPVTFSKRLRRDPQSVNPRVPIILAVAQARARQVELARDAGANDLIVRPISAKTLKAKLKAVLLEPPSFVDAEDFRGPDRRRRVERRKPENAVRSAPLGERRNGGRRGPGPRSAS